MVISGEVLRCGGPCSTSCTYVCVLCAHTYSEEWKKMPGAVRALETVRVCMWQWLPFSLFMTLPPGQAADLSEERREGRRAGKEGGRGGKKAIGRFRGERCSGPVSFYGPLKKKRENEHPSCLDWLLLLRLPGSFHKLLFSTLLSSYNGHSCIYPGSISSGCRKPAKISTTNDLP